MYIEDGENGLYYHDGEGTYTNADQEAGDNSYRFSGGDYQVTETATGAGLTRVYTAASAETNGVINFYCDGSKSFVGNLCESTQTHYYTTAYNEETHYDTLEEALTQAVSDGYLTSDNIKNFVCFGPEASEGLCPEDNLYRIIGVFDGQVKLMKYTYADSDMLGVDGDYSQIIPSAIYSGVIANKGEYAGYYWNKKDENESINDWKISRLNIVNLNTNYWNYLGSEWQSKIVKHNWQIGGNIYTNIRDVSVKNAYNNELVNPIESITYQDEIGLIYVSDYMYAVDSRGWTNVGYNETDVSNGYNALKGENWMYMGLYDWTITKASDIDYASLIISSAGYVYSNYIHNEYNSGDQIRPVFYLNSDVQIYEGHAGTASDPYRIVI